MSSLYGKPEEIWSLPAAAGELGSAARWAKQPGMIWVAGIWYPSLILNLEAIRTILALMQRTTPVRLPAIFGVDEDTPLLLPLAPELVIEQQTWIATLLMALLFVVPALAIYRLNVGLAFLAAPHNPETPGLPGDEQPAPSPMRALADVWRAGKGLGVSAFGMWITLMGLLVGAMVFLFGPLTALVQMLQLQEVSAVLVGLTIPVVVMIAGYGIVLQVVNQLALHSLAQNRRGVASALVHAWRLMRNQPWAALRATLLDVALFLSVLVAGAVGGTLLSIVPVFGWFAAWFLGYLLIGFAGVVRAGFWARAYHAFGGPLRSERIPGLEVVVEGT